MLVNITGLTASTITFNTLGIILRGNIVARNINLVNDAQLREVTAMKNAKLISVEMSDEDRPAQPSPIPIQTQPQNNPSLTIVTNVTEIEPVEPNEQIEDQPSPSPVKRGRGRPKGSRNKVKESKTTSQVTPQPPKTIKKITKSIDHSAPLKEGEEDDSEVTVMTPGGPVKGKAIKNMSGNLPESDATKASIEAMKKLEEEEAAQEIPVVIDESKLDPSERMGGKAVIVTGISNAEKVTMKNSFLPEAEQIKRAVKFIELKDAETLSKEEDRSKNAFIDGIDDIADPNNEDDGVES